MCTQIPVTSVMRRLYFNSVEHSNLTESKSAKEQVSRSLSTRHPWNEKIKQVFFSMPESTFS